MILDQAIVEGLAHAVQALELVAVDAARPGDDRGDGERVVGRELRVENRPQLQELLGAGHVVEIGHRLAREDRVVVEPALLGALHLRVPVGALDEAHHQPPPVAAGERRDVVDHRAGALLVALDGEAEPVPVRERVVGEHGADHVEGEFEPVRLLRIDGEVEVVGPRLLRERDDGGHELGHHPGVAQRLVARMQGRQLHRDAGPVRQRLVAGGAADRLDRGGIGEAVAVRVVGRAGAFAEHVEGIAVEPAFAGRRALQRLPDRLAEHEMVAHDAHRLPRRRPHRRQAEALGELAQDALRRLARLDDAGGDAERPGGGRDEEGVRLRFVTDEIALAELVLDEAVGGGRIGHPQERFGEDHQGEALLRRQGVFAQHLLDAAEAGAPGADCLDEPPRRAVDRPLFVPRKTRRREEAARDRGVVLRIRRIEDGNGGGHGAISPGRAET